MSAAARAKGGTGRRRFIDLLARDAYKDDEAARDPTRELAFRPRPLLPSKLMRCEFLATAHERLIEDRLASLPSRSWWSPPPAPPSDALLSPWKPAGYQPIDRQRDPPAPGATRAYRPMHGDHHENEHYASGQWVQARGGRVGGPGAYNFKRAWPFRRGATTPPPPPPGPGLIMGRREMGMGARARG